MEKMRLLEPVNLKKSLICLATDGGNVDQTKSVYPVHSET